MQLKPCENGILCQQTCLPPYYECVYCNKNFTGLHCDIPVGKKNAILKLMSYENIERVDCPSEYHYRNICGIWIDLKARRKDIGTLWDKILLITREVSLWRNILFWKGSHDEFVRMRRIASSSQTMIHYCQFFCFLSIKDFLHRYHWLYFYRHFWLYSMALDDDYLKIA